MPDDKIVNLQGKPVDNVTPLHPERVTIPVSDILAEVAKADFTTIIVIGVDKTGKVSMAHSGGSTAESLFLLEQAKRDIWEIIEDVPQ